MSCPCSALPTPQLNTACRYSVFTVVSIHIPAKITGSNPIVVHIDAAIDNADEDEELPLATCH